MENLRRVGEIPYVKPIATAVVVGGIVAVATPVVVSTVGFKATGIAAGSSAASMMSTFGGGVTPAGGIVATCQSIGAVGAISKSTAIAFGGVVALCEPYFKAKY